MSDKDSAGIEPTVSNSELIETLASPFVYQKGRPTQQGIYACRVPSEFNPIFHEDLFLAWFEDRWGYLGSDQYCRREVIGWIGPLPRTRS